MLLRQKHEFVNEYAKTHQAGRIDCVCEIVIANYGKCPMAIAR